MYKSNEGGSIWYVIGSTSLSTQSEKLLSMDQHYYIKIEVSWNASEIQVWQITIVSLSKNSWGPEAINARVSSSGEKLELVSHQHCHYPAWKNPYSIPTNPFFTPIQLLSLLQKGFISITPECKGFFFKLLLFN